MTASAALPTNVYNIPTLRSYQAEAGRAIVDSVLNRRGLTFTVMMARQAGKNELSAQIELYLLLKNSRRRLEGIKAAPTFLPQGYGSMRRLWSRVLESGLRQGAEREGAYTVRVGSARMTFLSAEPAANVAGHTASMMLEVDEAQDVDIEKFDRDFRPMASAYGATTIYYGTPWDDSTLLEQMVQHNLELERRDGIRRHFTADWQEVAALNPDYARFVEGERARLGETHPLFLTQYCLQQVPGSGCLFSGPQQAQLAGNHSRQHSPTSGGVYVAGLDIGGGMGESDHDSTVLTIGRAVEPRPDALVQTPCLEIVEHISFTGVPHDELLSRLADVLGRVWRVQAVTVDATGLGETITRMLQRALGDDVVRPYRFSAESKSRLGYDLIAAVNGGRLRMYAADGSPEYAEFWRQMELARVAYRSGQQMNFFVDPKDGHDDYLVSVALAAQSASEAVTAPRIARGRVRAA
jgi:hypothetical protein